MSVLQFPYIQYFIQLTSSGIEHAAGSFNTAEDFELAHMQVYAQKVGAHAGSERFRIKLFKIESLEDGYEYAISDWVQVSDITSLGSGGWYGYITFDFNREPILSGDEYYMAIEAENYTKPVDDSYYWGFALDWPNDINDTTTATSRSLQFSLLGYVET